MRPSLLLAALVVTGLAMTACTPSRDAAAPVPDAAPTLRAMSPQQVTSQIAPSFPEEVPVPEGRVVSGKAQGEDAWDYEVIVDAPPSALASWYRQVYVGRSWAVVAEDAEPMPDGDRYTLTLRKMNAESQVVVVPDGEGSRATVILGVGAPVLQTQ